MRAKHQLMQQIFVLLLCGCFDVHWMFELQISPLSLSYEPSLGIEEQGRQGRRRKANHDDNTLMGKEWARVASDESLFSNICISHFVLAEFRLRLS